MQGLRSTSEQLKASDGLARLDVGSRSVRLIEGETEPRGDEAPPPRAEKRAKGKARRGRHTSGPAENATEGRSQGQAVRSAKGAVSTTAKGAQGAAAATGKLGYEVSNDDDATDLADRQARQLAARGAKEFSQTAGKGAAKVVRSGGRLTGNLIRGGSFKATRTTAPANTAAATAKASHRTAQAGASASRAAAAAARAAAATANAVRAIAGVVASVASSTPALAIAAVTVAVVAAILAIISAFIPASASVCDLSTGGYIDATKIPETSVAGYGPEQLINAAHIMRAGQDKGLSIRDQTIAVMTAMGESSLTVLDYGDDAGPDSRGLFQQRDSWGTYEQRMDPYTSATLFYNALVAVPETEREQLAPTLVAHKVQKNLDPYHYESYWQPANAVVGALNGGGVQSLCSTAGVGGIGGEIGLDGWAKVANPPVTSSYGPRAPIQTSAGTTYPFHFGMDFGSGCNAPIWAARDGIVSGVYTDPFGAWVIDIQHENGLMTRYKHMYAHGVLVMDGQSIAAGQQIGLIGSSGMATGCHLHFELHQNGVQIDPLPIFTAAGITF